MTMDDFWKIKLWSYIHDPAEKALILLRTKEGHEEGTVKDLRDELFGFKENSDFDDIVKKADRWAASSDRIELPYSKKQNNNKQGSFNEQFKVNFAKNPELIHPISGQRVDFEKNFSDIVPQQIEQLSGDYFKSLKVSNSQGETDYELTYLAFWRFGPLIGAEDIRSLWRVLPADTRIPQHSIWQHLDLTSAIAGSLAKDKDSSPAIFSVALGPVQSFIANARSSSDFWAGSHLIAYLTWCAIESVIEDYGPDSVIFPNLRGLYWVDKWLFEKFDKNGQQQKWSDLLKEAELEDAYSPTSDAHPYYIATIPNRFTAIVPFSKAKEIGDKLKDRVKKKLKSMVCAAIEKIKETNSFSGKFDNRQIENQLKDFPQIFWSCLKWPASEDGKSIFDSSETKEIEQLVRKIQGSLDGTPFEKNNKDLLSNELSLTDPKSGTKYEFFKPNSGIIYASVFELNQRLLAASKNQYQFKQIIQEGFRCTLCGEREWLSDQSLGKDKNNNQVDLKFVTVNQEKNLKEENRDGGLWAALSKERPSWVKSTERLCTICMLKRLWPSINKPESLSKQEYQQSNQQVRRHVVSTHTMALVPIIEKYVEIFKNNPDKGSEFVNKVNKVKELFEEIGIKEDDQYISFPKKIHKDLEDLEKINSDASKYLRKLPDILDKIRDNFSQLDDNFSQLDAVEKIKELSVKCDGISDLTHFTYYAIIKSDGDQMGRLLSGKSNELKIGDLIHKEIIKNLQGDGIKKFLDSQRLSSPSLHESISEALNNFAVELAPLLIENCCSGKIIYAGGDDLLALLPVNKLRHALRYIKSIYQGHLMDDSSQEELGESIKVNNGWVFYNNKLLMAMGEKSTISVGAVVAHYSMPLLVVMSELNKAVEQAKNNGRDSLCIKVLKRSGGVESFTSKFSYKENGECLQPMLLMKQFEKLIKERKVSRRSIYLLRDTLSQLNESNINLEEESQRKMVTGLVELNLQSGAFNLEQSDVLEIKHLSTNLINLVFKQTNNQNTEILAKLNDFIGVAEFLARYDDRSEI
jgi:CRISPR-associated protein Cmr2